MAYAMVKLMASLCMALLVVHVDSARMLQQVGDDTIGMTAETFTTESTVDDFGRQGTPPAADEAAEFQSVPGTDDSGAYNYNKDSVTTVSAEEFADSGTFAPPTDVSFAQEDSVLPATLYKDVDEPDARTESFAEDKSAEGTEGFLVDNAGTDSFASADQGILVDDTTGTDAKGDSKYSYDATKGDPEYPTGSSDESSEFTLAEANPQFEYATGNESTTDKADQSFEFDEDNKPQEYGP